MSQEVFSLNIWKYCFCHILSVLDWNLNPTWFVLRVNWFCLHMYPYRILLCYFCNSRVFSGYRDVDLEGLLLNRENFLICWFRISFTTWGIFFKKLKNWDLLICNINYKYAALCLDICTLQSSPKIKFLCTTIQRHSLSGSQDSQEKLNACFSCADCFSDVTKWF